MTHERTQEASFDITGDITGGTIHTAPAATDRRLEAVVSVLDERSQEQVLALWEELRREFHITDNYTAPIPHFSYHVAQAYDPEALDQALREFAGEWAPFHVRTGGLGVFTGSQPVLYIPIVREARLSLFHAELCRRLRPLASDPAPYYFPENWLPHITLTLGAVDPQTLAAVIAHLSPRRFDWSMAVHNLTAICDDCGVLDVNQRYPLQGSR